MEYFTVADHGGEFQSVFPRALAHRSQMHLTQADGWFYIAEIILLMAQSGETMRDYAVQGE